MRISSQPCFESSSQAEPRLNHADVGFRGTIRPPLRLERHGNEEDEMYIGIGGLILLIIILVILF